MKRGVKFILRLFFFLYNNHMDSSQFKAKLSQIKTNTSVNKEVSFDNIKVTLQPLNSSDEIALAESVKDSEGISYLLKVKKETLARSICKVDGEDLGDSLKEGEIDVDKVLWVKKNLLDILPQTAVDEFFNAYLVLQLEIEEKVKKSVKFDNSDAINKFIEAEVTKKAMETVQKVVDTAKE